MQVVIDQAQILQLRSTLKSQIVANLLFFAMLSSFSMGNQREQKRYIPKKDFQPEVTATDLTEKVNGHLDTLIEAIKSGNTERLTNYLAFSSRFHHY